MIEKIIQAIYNRTHKNSFRYTANMFTHGCFGIPIGNIVIYHKDRQVLHDIVDDRIIKLEA